VLTISIILYKLLQKNNINPDIVAGHSLGEYLSLDYRTPEEYERLLVKNGSWECMVC